jgi:hypothetical protein
MGFFIILQKTKTRLITFFVTYFRSKKEYLLLAADLLMTFSTWLAGVQRETKQKDVNGQDTMSSWDGTQLITAHEGWSGEIFGMINGTIICALMVFYRN